MKKIIATAALTTALILGASGPAQAALSIELNSAGRVKFSSAVRAKLATPAQKKIINTRAKKYGSPKVFEKDMRGCELQYKIYTIQQSDCLNMTIRYHGYYA